MPRKFWNGINLPLAPGLGKTIQSDASGNMSWVNDLSMFLTPMPSGFTTNGARTYNVYRVGDSGTFKTDYDMQADRPAAGVTYYVSPSTADGGLGISTNPGTLVSPLIPSTALAKVDIGTMIMLPGEYYRNASSIGVITKDLNIVAYSAGVKLTAWERPSALTWTLTSGNIYQAARSQCQLVIDKRDLYRAPWGDYAVYQKTGATASTITGPGQWATDNVTVWVWPLGNSSLVTDATFMRLSINVAGTGVQVNGGFKVYVEGVNVEACGTSALKGFGSWSSGQPAGGVFLAKDCTIRYSPGDAAGTAGGVFCCFDNCETSSNALDGFNYHYGTITPSGFAIPDILEMNCRSFRNGLLGSGRDEIWQAAENNNASTAHDGIAVVRLNGDFRETYGPTLVDVASGTRSWNLGCKVGGSLAPTQDVGVQSTTSSLMWLDSCSISDCATAMNAISSSIIRHRGEILRRNFADILIATAGDIQRY